MCDQLDFPVSDPTISRRDKGVHAEPKGGCGVSRLLLNVEIPAWLNGKAFLAVGYPAFIQVCLR